MVHLRLECTYIRWLVNQGRNEEAIVVLSHARNLPPDSDLVQIEFKYVGFFLHFTENT